MRILLLLLVAGVAIGIAGALFFGRETVARNPAVAGTALSPSAAAPAAGPSPDGGTPDAGSMLEQDSAVERGAATAGDADSDEASAGDSDPAPPAAADETAASAPPDAAAASATPDDTAAPATPENNAAADTGTAPTPASSDGAANPAAPAPAGIEPPATVTADESVVADAAAELIEQLRPLVAERDANIPDYDRDHFAGWLDSDGDCVNTRHEILQAEAVDFSMNAEGCAVDSGEWFDPYTDRTFTDPRDLDVDHVVALADAWVSGAWEWADELLDRFSNDLGNLNAIAAGENRSKSAKGPAEYNPTAPAARCDYLVQYATVKIRWGLSITPQDFEVVVTSLTGCDVGIVPDASPTAVDTPSAATEITTSTTQPASDCHPAYEPCLPNLPGDALNCGDLRGDQKPVTVIRPGTDPYRLDRDGDGRGCTG